MKFVKRILLVLFILLVLSAGSVFMVITFYKKELTQVLMEELKLKYGLTLLVEDVNVTFKDNWPRISVQLRNVSVASERHHKTTEPFLRASSMSISFNFLKLLQKQFVIKHISLAGVDLNLIKFADGSKNFEFLKNKDTSSTESGISLNLDKISLTNVNFLFRNDSSGQNISLTFKRDVIKLKKYDEGVRAKMEGEVHINGLLFKPIAGEFLTNTLVNLQLEAVYFFKDKTITVLPPSYASIENQKYNLASIIDFSDKKLLAICIMGKEIKKDRVSKHLSPKIKKALSNYEVSKALEAKFLLVTKMGQKQDPIIIVDVKGKNCDLTIGKTKVVYTNLYFEGRMLSMHQSKKRGDKEHAKITFKNIKGKINDFPFEADIEIIDLPKPKIDLKASIVIDEKGIGSDKTKDYILKGTALASLHYSGNLRYLNKEKFLNDSANLTAYLLFNNLNYKKVNQAHEFVLNGKATLDKLNLSFDRLFLKTLFGEFNLKGKIEQPIQFVLGITKLLKGTIDARSEFINLDKLLIKNNEPSIQSKKIKKTNDVFEKAMYNFSVKLSASNLALRKIKTSQVQIALQYTNKLITISKLNVRTCDGEIKAQGKITDLNKIESKVNITNVNATSLFEQFENFGQEAVKSENIKGRIFLDGTFSAGLDHENKFKGASVISDIAVKVKDGHLIDFEPLQNISNFVLKEKDLKDVSFSELNENLKIRGFEIRLDEFEVNSNIITLYIVNGLYNLKGNSNINMLIPWSNLKRMRSNAIPKSSGQSAQNTNGLKLNYSGPPKKMKLSFGHKEQEKRFW